MSEHRISMSDGAVLHVKILGHSSTRAKPLLIALHGAPGFSDHTEPESTFGFLADRFRILVYDARGSGDSDLVPPYTNQQWIADVEELRVWAGVEQFVLAGGSYGGFLALDYALAHGHRLRALILRDTWAWGTRGMMRALKESLTDDRLKVDPDRQYRMWTGVLLDDDDFAKGIPEMAVLFSPRVPGPHKATVAAEGGTNSEDKKYHSATQNAAFSYNMPRFDVRERLEEIAAPTLVIVGRQDQITPVEYSEEIHAGLPNSQLAIFEHSGHNPSVDEPQAFQERITRFVAGIGIHTY